MQQADVEKFRIYMRAWKGNCDAFCLGTMPNLVGLLGKLIEKWDSLLMTTYLLLCQTIMWKIMNAQQQAKVSVHSDKKVFMEMKYIKKWTHWTRKWKKSVQNVMHSFARKFITALLFVENASKHCYATKEIMKRWYLFHTVLLLAGYKFCYIKSSIFLSMFCCFYTDFTGLSTKWWH